MATYSSAKYNNLNKIFRDTTDNHDYTNLSLHFFDAGTSTIDTTAIVVNDVSFATTYSSEIIILLRFDNKFVSGGYTSYSLTSINAFSDWSSGYAVNGQNYISYSNTGVGGYKWIAINIEGKRGDGSADSLVTP